MAIGDQFEVILVDSGRLSVRLNKGWQPEWRCYTLRTYRLLQVADSDRTWRVSDNTMMRQYALLKIWRKNLIGVQCITFRYVTRFTHPLCVYKNFIQRNASFATCGEWILIVAYVSHVGCLWLNRYDFHTTRYFIKGVYFLLVNS